MRIQVILRAGATPLGGAAYPAGPYRFCRREYLNITYRTDPEALRAVVPEPLEVAEPLVRFEVIKMPDSSGLGAYTESGQVLRVVYEGGPADYIHSMYLDNAPAIALVAPLADLPVRKVVSASHILTDLTLPQAELVHDYLAT